MRGLLLSYFSPEVLSAAGFLLLVGGLVGDVAVLIVPAQRYLTNALLGLFFTSIVAIGVVIEHIGDNESFRIVSDRAQTAEDELKRINTPRIIDDSKYATLVACLHEAPKGPVYVRAGFMDRDAVPLGQKIESALKEAGFPPPPPWPPAAGDEKMFSWGAAGIFIIARDRQVPHALPVYQCLEKIGLKVVGWEDPKHPEGAVSIAIGSRF